MSEQQPLPEDWEERDFVGSWWLAHFEIGQRVKEGAPLPAMFVPRGDAGALADMCRGLPNDALDDLIDEAAGR